ncbi:MAG: cell envelope integrity EipB family protein [Proteobacteria bacterium]|nr:cell envelope integrity EipB family protein [Pseudomonadota bacterium]
MAFPCARSRAVLIALAVAVLGVTGTGLTGSGLARAAPASGGGANDDVTLVPHRAVYDLKLAKSTGKRTIEGVSGRILYDFSGSACEGFSLQFRQVSELDSGEGKAALSDLRSSTWEDGNARNFRFKSENFLNEQSQSTVDGRAERRADGMGVTLTKPAAKTFALDIATVLPTEHIFRAIRAARSGKTILEFPVYDGSDNGEKIYNSLTVIGRPIAPDAHLLADAARGQAGLEKMSRWPMTVSYFDKNSSPGEQTPVYAISFELYENGISRALLLDYGNFSISGELKQLDIGAAKRCP